MSQTYRPLLGSDNFADSFGYLNGSIDAAASLFIGPAAPPLFPGRPWIDTINDLIKIGNEAGDGWQTLLKYGTDFGGCLPVTGGGMAGAINMNSFGITGLPLGTGTAAARQQELDLKAPLAAPAFTGDAQVNQDPNGNNSLTRRSWTEGRYLKLSGGTMTAPLFLNANAALSGEDLRAVPLQQLRDFVNFNVSTGHRHTGSDGRKIRGIDIDSGAASAGQFLGAAGSGASAYSTFLQAPMRFLETPIQLFSGSPPTSYSSVDVSANTDTDTYAAMLRVYSDIVDSGTFRFRKNGSAVDSAVLDWGPLTGQNVFPLTVELSAARVFQWRATGSVNVNAFKIHLIGYMRNNF
jgi:hypothetical protein